VRTKLAAAVFLIWPSLAFAAPLAPDPALTPGVADPAVTQANIDTTICVPGYTARVRNVPASEKHAVFAEYHIDPHGPGAPFEVDHLISLELGGANAIGNLWPQSYRPPPLPAPPWINAHGKDRLENALHALVCAHRLPLADAQRAIATDWEAAFDKYVNGE
jgi:hypothetical protein